MRPFSLLRLSAVALLICTMAACTTIEAAAPWSPKPTATTKAPTKKTVAKASPKPAKPQKAEPPAVPAPADAQPEVAQEPVAVEPQQTQGPAVGEPPQQTTHAPTPVDLVGKSEGEVLALLGRPNAERPATPGKILSFAGDGCAIDVHLFPDIKQGGFRALELISKGGDVAAAHCAGRIRSARG